MEYFIDRSKTIVTAVDWDVVVVCCRQGKYDVLVVGLIKPGNSVMGGVYRLSKFTKTSVFKLLV